MWMQIATTYQFASSHRLDLAAVVFYLRDPAKPFPDIDKPWNSKMECQDGKQKTSRLGSVSLAAAVLWHLLEPFRPLQDQKGVRAPCILCKLRWRRLGVTSCVFPFFFTTLDPAFAQSWDVD